MANIGVDFGSSFTTVSWINPLNGNPEAVKFNGDGSVKLPSAILSSNNGLVFGFQAQNYLEDIYKLPIDDRLEFLSYFIPSLKRTLNASMTETLGNRTYSHVELLTLFFKHMLEMVRAHCGNDTHFDSVTFSHPIEFEESKINIIRQAFSNCGLSIKETKFEPLAAVEGYSLGHAIQENEGILVFDFGGGTIDVAYVQKRFSKLKVVCEPRGSSTCGGQDLDHLIYEDLRKKVLNKYSFDISLDGFVDYCILNNCRRLKEYFSGTSDYYETQVALVINKQFVHYKYGLNRESFNNIIGGKIQEAINIAQQVIGDVHRHEQEVDKVLLIGGSSQLTLVKEQFAALLPNASIETCGEKDIAVALGNNYANIIKSEPTTNSEDNKKTEEDKDNEIESDISLDMSRCMKCQNPKCGSEKCYKIIGRRGYHCVECGWEGINVIVTYKN